MNEWVSPADCTLKPVELEWAIPPSMKTTRTIQYDVSAVRFAAVKDMRWVPASMESPSGVKLPTESSYDVTVTNGVDSFTQGALKLTESEAKRLQSALS